MFFNAFFALLRTYLRTWRGSCLAVVCYDILYQVSYQNRKPIRTFSSAHPSLPFATLALTAKVWTRCRVCDSWCVQLGCKYWRWRHGLAPWLIKRGFRLTHVHIFDYFWLFLTTISPEQSLHSKAKWYIGTSYSLGDALHGIVVHMPIAETAVFFMPWFCPGGLANFELMASHILHLSYPTGRTWQDRCADCATTSAQAWCMSRRTSSTISRHETSWNHQDALGHFECIWMHLNAFECIWQFKTF